MSDGKSPTGVQRTARSGQNDLSEKSKTILAFIAGGHNYEQILTMCPGCTYLDIFESAREALASAAVDYEECLKRFSQTKRKHKRAFEKWDTHDDARLREMFAERKSINEMSKTLERQKGAVESRLRRLGL